MKIDIRKADRTDLTALLDLLCENKTTPVIDNALRNKFDEILCQTNHSILVAFENKRAVGTMSVTIINGLGDGYPRAVLTGAKIADGFEKTGIESVLLENAQYIADGLGCVRNNGFCGNYACKRII